MISTTLRGAWKRVALVLIGVSLVVVLCVVGWAVLVLGGPTKTLLRGSHAEPWAPSAGAAPARVAADREPCADHDPLRNAYFGDLHIHTAYSYDSSGRGVRTTPDGAYRFARGEPIDLPPYDAGGNAARRVQLERPLDFAAVTDHAEYIGEVSLCMNTRSGAYGGDHCRAFRRETRFGLLPKGIGGMVAMFAGARSEEFCGEDAADCREALVSAWRDTGNAAERWYDRTSACRFTTFHGYEYTYRPAANRVHRNVIFRNEVVPELPISSIDEPEPEMLWRRLRELCLDIDGDCDVLAIPHNPNHSSGRMFRLGDPNEPVEEARARARLRAEMEPLVEMMQIKGESECRNGLWGVAGAPDELCGLEKFEPLGAATDCEGGVGFGRSLGLGCVSRTDYARYTIAAGLSEEKRLGVNPFRVGFIGSTDTHNGTPGDVEEWDFEGSRGLVDATPAQRLQGPIQRNPGGLVGLWAEENSRDALFEAMRRREAFATSGPRMTVRFFGGWDGFGEQGWCDRPDAVASGYAHGVPMGGILLPAPGDGTHPVFAVLASRDPGTGEHPGGLLERVQIIKVWANPEGEFHQEVHDVAGGKSGAAVDLATCAPHGPGAEILCGVWRDPSFDPAVSSAYYARVVENPSCRWTTWHCLSLVSEDRPAVCDDPNEPKLTRERAWSSPIWYVPPSAE